MKTGIFTMKRVLAFTIAVVASMTMLAGGTQPVMTAQNASAESQAIKNNKKKISSAKDKISELEQKQADLDKQINSTKDDISKEEENQKAIQEQIETVQETILALEDSITDLKTEIADLEEAIAKSEIKIKNKRTEIENGVVDFKQRLRAMYVAGNSSYTDILIGSTDFYDMLMKIELVKRVADHDNTMIDGLVELKGEYESQEAELEANKTELETNKTTLEEQKAYHTEQKKKLDDLYAKSQAVIDQLEEDKAAYEANKEQINKEQEDFETQLQKLYKEQEQSKKKEEEERKKKEEEERIAREKAEQAAREALALVNISEEYFEYSPFDLSGGQKKRVALAGILAYKPEILILDEPVAGMDPKSKWELFALIRRLHEERNITVIFVSHDMKDVYEIADRILVMGQGKLVYDGAVEQAFGTPEIVEKLGLEMPEMAMFREALLPEIKLTARSVAGVIEELSGLKNI